MSLIKDLISVGLDGSGTAGYVSKWLDANSITDSVIYESSGNIGIGTTSPTNYGSTYKNLDIAGTAGAYITLKGTDTPVTLDIAADGLAGYVGTKTAHPLRIRTNDIERLRIDSAGNVGIGTSSPAETLDVSRGNTSGAVVKWSSTGRKSGYLYTDTTGVGIYDTSLNSAGIYLYENNRIDFRVNGSERMRITSGGNVLVGTTTDGYFNKGVELDKNGAIFLTRDGNIPMWVNRLTNTGVLIEFAYNSSVKGTISTNGSSVSYNTTSDYRLKENVVEMTGALDRVDALKPSRFNFIADPETTVDGFLAHEVADVVPEAVTGEKDAVDEEGNPEYQGIDQSKLVPLLVGAIKELKARIEILENK